MWLWEYIILLFISEMPYVVADAKNSRNDLAVG